MNKIRLAIIFFAIVLLGGISSAFAQSYGRVVRYVGTMEVKFNGVKKPDVKNVVHYLKRDDDGGYELSLRNFKVGKMPGKMKFELDDLYMGENFDRFEPELIEFDIPMLPDVEYDADAKGIITEDKVEYTIKTIDATYMGKAVNVEIRFVGHRQK